MDGYGLFDMTCWFARVAGVVRMLVVWFEF